MSQVSQLCINVLFVCTGNICRSPMAEAVFAHLVEQAGLSDRFAISSAGTRDWHVGESPHRGTLDALRRHAILPIRGKRAQVVSPAMLARADYVVALDSSHVDDLRSLEILGDSQVPRLLDYAPDQAIRDMPDPYYTGEFEKVFQLTLAGARGLLDHIQTTEKLC